MSTLFLEAFGQLSGPSGIDSQEEDLYSVFRARGELLGWSTTSDSSSLLWDMEEAELTAGFDADRIGWVQVGLAVGPSVLSQPPPSPVHGWFGMPTNPRSTDPVNALPALVQCFSDALSRFGDIELSGIQVSASGLETHTGDGLGFLVSILNWFNVDVGARADALVAFDEYLIGNGDVDGLVADLKSRNTGPFDFRSVVAVPEQHSVNVGNECPIRSVPAARGDLGVSVALPEWTASAVGWVLAMVIDTARVAPPEVGNFVIRVTRV